MDCRIGFGKQEVTDDKDPEDEVNEYLMRAIDARSIDRLRSEHCKQILLTFKEQQVEDKYMKEKDRMLSTYFVCSFWIYSCLSIVQLIITPFPSFQLVLIVLGEVVLAALNYILLKSKHKVTVLRRIAAKIRENRSVPQLLGCFVLALTYLLSLSALWVPRDIDQYSPVYDYVYENVLLTLIMCAVYQILTSLLKLAALAVIVVSYILLHLFLIPNTLVCFSDLDYMFSSQQLVVLVLPCFLAAFVIHGQHTESTYRLDFLWKLQATEEKEEMEHLEAYNRKLVENILPVHVAEHFLNRSNAEEWYHEQCDSVCIMFASIPNFSEFYVELEGNNEGVECLRLLNEIIADFDELLSQDRFRYVEKIKSTGATYMAASGLTRTTCDMKHFRHVTAMADYALQLKEQLKEVNEHSFNNFRIRIGINIGPVVAGVIGARKPQYDIWGNAVNVASRMDSTGVPDSIQVTQEVHDILSARGYPMECRGSIQVKGKGTMVTYLLTGKPVTSVTSQINSPDTVND